MNLKRKLSLIVFGLIVGGSVLWYWLMGGYADIVVNEVSDYKVTLYGQFYEGSVKNKGFGACFEQAENMVKENDMPGSYAAAYYFNTPTDQNGMKVKAFVGAVVMDTTWALNDKFQYQTFVLDRALKASQDAHHLVSNTYKGVQEYANEHKLKLDSLYSLEEYPEEGRFILYVPYD